MSALTSRWGRPATHNQPLAADGKSASSTRPCGRPHSLDGADTSSRQHGRYVHRSNRPLPRPPGRNGLADRAANRPDFERGRGVCRPQPSVTGNLPCRPDRRRLRDAWATLAKPPHIDDQLPLGDVRAKESQSVRHRRPSMRLCRPLGKTAHLVCDVTGYYSDLTGSTYYPLTRAGDRLPRRKGLSGTSGNVGRTRTVRGRVRADAAITPPPQLTSSVNGRRLRVDAKARRPRSPHLNVPAGTSGRTVSRYANRNRTVGLGTARRQTTLVLTSRLLSTLTLRGKFSAVAIAARRSVVWSLLDPRLPSRPALAASRPAPARTEATSREP